MIINIGTYNYSIWNNDLFIELIGNPSESPLTEQEKQMQLMEIEEKIENKLKDRNLNW